MKRLSFFRERQRVNEVIAAMETTFRTELKNEREKHMSDLENIGKLLSDIDWEDVDRRLHAVEHGLHRLIGILTDYTSNPSAIVRESTRLIDELNTIANPAPAAPEVPPLPPTDAVVSTATETAPDTATPPAPETAPTASDAAPAATDAPAPSDASTAPETAADVPTPTGEATPAWSPDNGDAN